VRRYFYPALEAAEMLRIRFHDPGHTYASLGIEQGENSQGFLLPFDDICNIAELLVFSIILKFISI